MAPLAGMEVREGSGDVASSSLSGVTKLIQTGSPEWDALGP